MFEADIISVLTNEWIHMNRRKKGVQILKARAKKSNAKLSTQSKPKYISKADRVESVAEAADNAILASEK
jgi:hypothetical protein